MKVSQQQLEALLGALTVCKDLDMKNAILTPNKLCAIRDDTSALIIHEFATPLFDFDVDHQAEYRIAVSRLPVLVQRLELVIKNSPIATLDPHKDKPYYMKIGLKAGKTSLDFRFGDPAFLKGVVPTGIKLDPVHSMVFSEQQIKQIVDAARAFSPEHIWINTMPTGTEISMIDTITGDALSIQLTDKEDVTSATKLKYGTQVFLKLLNQKGQDVPLTMHRNGAIAVSYRGLTSYALRRE
jgi:hypothetical protein